MQRSRSSGQSKDSLVTLNGNIVVTITTASNAASLVLHPNSINRQIQVSDAFNLYRFTRLRVTVYPQQGASATTSAASGGSIHAAFIDQDTDTDPTTVLQISECMYHACVVGVQTVPATFTVPRGALLKVANKWFKTKLGTPDTWNEIQGEIFFITTSPQPTADSYQLKLDYQIQYCDPVSAAITPMYVMVPPARAGPNSQTLPTAGNPGDRPQRLRELVVAQWACK